jgi:polar amino acid transport system substrate-binding protein
MKLKPCHFMPFLFVILLSFNASSETLPDLKIVTTNEFPFQYQTKQNNNATEKYIEEGISYELVKSILKHSGIKKYEIKWYPWARAYRIAQEEKNTAIFSIMRAKEREELFDWTCKILETNTWVYRLKKREDIKIEKIEDLKDYKIAVWRDDFRHQFLEKKLGHRKLYLTESDQSAILMVRDERADVFLFYDSTFPIFMKTMNLDQNLFKRVFKINELSGDSLYLATNKESDPYLIKMLKIGLEKSKLSGEFDMIIGKFNSLTIE